MSTEAIIQFFWKNSLFGGKSLRTSCGLSLEVLYPGDHNFHAGPDFTNARIRLDQLIWAGNVEVHVHASHWYLHGHHRDPAYDTVILHVVLHFDRATHNSRGCAIPTFIIDPQLLQESHLAAMNLSENWLLCHNYIRHISSKTLKTWYDELYRERMNQKILQMTRLMHRYPGDREKAFFVALASGFGLPVNRLPFEMMASGIPVVFLKEIKNCLPDVEALLFGHSGLLPGPGNKGSYTAALLQRYTRLYKRGPSHPVPAHLWKFLRIRPASFPTLRLSQFASLIHLHFPFYEKFMHSECIPEMEQWMEVRSSSYWNTHYTFTNPSPPAIKKMGRQAILNIRINVLIPFMGAIQLLDPACHDHIHSIKFLHKLGAETNHIIKKWISFGINPDNALESQALIQLYLEYCTKKRCPDCEIGKMKPASCP